MSTTYLEEHQRRFEAAVRIMPVLVAKKEREFESMHQSELARRAVDYADALLAALDLEPPSQGPTEHSENTEAEKMPATTKDTKGLPPVSSWLVCPWCRKHDRAELYPSKTDRTGYTLYCRRCEEGCVSPLECSVQEGKEGQFR